jgi:nucleotide-binding universal stress UspA family protein
MSTTHHTQVVVAYDFTKSAKAALYRAIALANRAPFHVLHFCCVIEPYGAIPSLPHHGRVDYGYAERVQQAVTDEVTAELKAASINDRVHFCVHARIGKAADEILELARQVGADLIIIGSKGSVGVERLMLGSVSERVVREAHCTVEVARPKTYEYVELLELKEVEPHSHYIPPHRYTYDAHTSDLRPADWPLY